MSHSDNEMKTALLTLLGITGALREYDETASAFDPPQLAFVHVLAAATEGYLRVMAVLADAKRSNT